jgi:hypothetical protein
VEEESGEKRRRKATRQPSVAFHSTHVTIAPGEVAVSGKEKKIPEVWR